MKKDVRLYNVMFPIWFLILAWPLFSLMAPWLLLILPANFAIDSLVVLVAAWRMKLPERWKLWRRAIWKVWLLGFLCDAAGGLLIAGLCMAVEGGITANAIRFPTATLYALPGVALSGVLLYWANRWLSFRKAGLAPGQLRRMCLAIALCTAPYTMLLPFAV